MDIASFKQDFKRPFNMVSLILGVTGIGLAFYFYYFPREDKSLAYVTEGPSLIYDSKLSTPKLKLIESDNTPVTTDTYLQNFTVWNNGSQPIEPVDVRRPITFFFQDAEKILDYKIVSATDADVCGFELAATNLAGIKFKNAVELKWKHFDPAKAVKIQVIYAQSGKPKPFISADIVGVGKLTSGLFKRNWSQLIGLISFFFLVYMCVGALRAVVKAREGWGIWKWLPIGLLSGALVFFVWLIFTILRSQLSPPTPPIF